MPLSLGAALAAKMQSPLRNRREDRHGHGTIDEFDSRDLTVRWDVYYRGERPARGGLEICKTHWGRAIEVPPLNPSRHRYCSGSAQGGSCVIVRIRTEGADKDRVEVMHRGTLLRGFYIMPRAPR